MLHEPYGAARPALSDVTWSTRPGPLLLERFRGCQAHVAANLGSEGFAEVPNVLSTPEKGRSWLF